jgi:hypothetical protein
LKLGSVFIIKWQTGVHLDVLKISCIFVGSMVIFSQLILQR